MIIIIIELWNQNIPAKPIPKAWEVDNIITHTHTHTYDNFNATE